MIAQVVMAIAIFIAIAFFLYMLFTKEQANSAYVKFVLVAYPFVSIDILPSILSFNLFDFITGVFLVLFYQKKDYPIKPNTIYTSLFVLFIFNTIAGIFFAEDYTRETITAIIQVFSLYVFIRIMVLELLNESKIRDEILQIFKAVLIFSFLFLCCQFFFGPSFSFAKSENINVAGGASVRYPSFFQDPQKYAQFLAAISFLLLIQNKLIGKTSNTIGYILAILSILALMLTGGRAGLGGWLIGLIVFLLFANAMYRAQLLVSVLVIGTIIFIYQDELPIFKRAGLEESYLFRQSIWQDALLIHKDNPIVGIGIGNYANYVSIHNPDQFWINGNEITYYDHPESGYLKILVEQGKFGFLLLFLMILVPVYHSFVTFAISKNTNQILFIAALISWLIGFYTVYSLGDVRIRILVASILVLLVSESYKTTKQYKIEDPR